MPWWAWSRCGILPRASAGSEPSAARLRAQPPLMPVWSPPVATSDCDPRYGVHAIATRECTIDEDRTGAARPAAGTDGGLTLQLEVNLNSLRGRLPTQERSETAASARKQQLERRTCDAWVVQRSWRIGISRSTVDACAAWNASRSPRQQTSFVTEPALAASLSQAIGHGQLRSEDNILRAPRLDRRARGSAPGASDVTSTLKSALLHTRDKAGQVVDSPGHYHRSATRRGRHRLVCGLVLWACQRLSSRRSPALPQIRSAIIPGQLEPNQPCADHQRMVLASTSPGRMGRS